MSLYDGIKDAAKLMQQADNIDLYRKLLDLSAEALDLQAENAKLEEEIRKLKRKKEIESRVVRHVEPFVTLKDEMPSLNYCSHCWDANRILIQLNCNEYNGSFICPQCSMTGIYDREREKIAYRDQEDVMRILY